MSKIANKKVLIVAIIIVTVLFAAIIISKSVSQDKGSSGAVGSEEDGEVIHVPSVADWALIEGGESEEGVIESSQLIGTGKVLSQEVKIREASADDYAMVFTVSKVRVDKLNALNKQHLDEIVKDIENETMIVEIIQTGGKGKGVSTPEIADAPLLEIGKEYLLFLAPSDDGLYIPVGGRLGYAEIINGRIAFVNDESKAMFVDFEGILKSKFSIELYDVIEKKVDIGNIIVNESNKKPVSFVEDIEIK